MIASLSPALTNTWPLSRTGECCNDHFMNIIQTTLYLAIFMHDWVASDACKVILAYQREYYIKLHIGANWCINIEWSDNQNIVLLRILSITCIDRGTLHYSEQLKISLLHFQHAIHYCISYWMGLKMIEHHKQHGRIWPMKKFSNFGVALLNNSTEHITLCTLWRTNWLVLNSTFARNTRLSLSLSEMISITTSCTIIQIDMHKNVQ